MYHWYLRRRHERRGRARRGGEIGELAGLAGFGKKTEQNILEGIEQDRTTEKKVKLSAAEQVAKFGACRGSRASAARTRIG
jgi:DNA polymerase/3'-5' exonuclease PolX